jgi:hypothetical protein
MKEFLVKYIEEILTVINKNFDMSEYALVCAKVSVSVDFAIFLIDEINKLDLEKSKKKTVIDSIVPSLPSLFPRLGGLKIYDVAASKNETKKIALEFISGGSSEQIEDVLTSNFGYQTLIGAFYNLRAEEYFGVKEDAPFVCSAMVTKLINNLRLDDVSFSLIQEINGILLRALIGSAEFFGSKEKAEPLPEQTKTSKNITKPNISSTPALSVIKRKNFIPAYKTKLILTKDPGCFSRASHIDEGEHLTTCPKCHGQKIIKNGKNACPSGEKIHCNSCDFDFEIE